MKPKTVVDILKEVQSPPVRGAWIETQVGLDHGDHGLVAPRAGGVD